MGSYISPDDTSEINNTEELISLCEKLNEHSPAVYPVEFILKSHAYPARMHFLAGNPTLTNQILGEFSPFPLNTLGISVLLQVNPGVRHRRRRN